MTDEIDVEMISVRKDILLDLYKAIDEVTEQISLGNDIYFGNVMILRDELEAVKKYNW